MFPFAFFFNVRALNTEFPENKKTKQQMSRLEKKKKKELTTRAITGRPPTKAALFFKERMHCWLNAIKWKKSNKKKKGREIKK